MARAGEASDPAVPAPRRVRALLRFTRLPDRALSVARGALDDDEDFRGRVRAATSEAEVGRPGWLFLGRPDGWSEELAALVVAAEEADAASEHERLDVEALRRLGAVEEALRRREEEVVRLQAELGRTKDRMTATLREQRLLRSDNGRLRKRVAELEAGLNATSVEAAALPEQLESVRSEAPPELPAPGAPERPEIDRQALATALSAAQGAAVALTDAMSSLATMLEPLRPPAMGRRRDDALPPFPAAGSDDPARAAPPPVALPPGVLDDSLAAAMHLVRVPDVVVLVDGYNVTKLARPAVALNEQRSWLLNAVTGMSARTGAEVVVVFDGAGEVGTAPADAPRRAGVQVRFTPAGTEADDALLDLATAAVGSRPVVVASSDRRVREGARRLKAGVITAAQLVGVLRS